MSKLSELALTLSGLEAKLEKARAEIVSKITELQTSLTDVELPAEAQTALDALTAKAQELDDIIADAPTVIP